MKVRHSRTTGRASAQGCPGLGMLARRLMLLDGARHVNSHGPWSEVLGHVSAILGCLGLYTPRNHPGLCGWYGPDRITNTNSRSKCLLREHPRPATSEFFSHTNSVPHPSESPPIPDLWHHTPARARAEMTGELGTGPCGVGGISGGTSMTGTWPRGRPGGPVDAPGRLFTRRFVPVVGQKVLWTHPRRSNAHDAKTSYEGVGPESSLWRLLWGRTKSGFDRPRAVNGASGHEEHLSLLETSGRKERSGPARP